MNTENMFQTRVIKNASYYRERARKMLTGVYWMAVLAAFIAALFGATVTGSSLTPVGGFAEEDYRFVFDGLGHALQDGEWIRRIVDHAGRVILLATGCVGALAVSVFLTSPLRVGYVKINLDLLDGKHPDANTVVNVFFSFFKKGLYWKTVRLNVLHGLILLASSIPSLIFLGLLGLCTISIIVGAPVLGGILTGVSGIAILMVLAVLALAAAILPLVMQYRYYFAFHILADCPEMTAKQALQVSAQMMNGKKWKLFCLHFSFIGWIFLAALTGGIGEFFLTPYTAAADAVFYGEGSQRGASADVEFPSIDPDDYDPNLAQW